MRQLSNLLQAIQAETGVTPSAFSIYSVEELPAISYTIYPQGDTGAVESWRFQTRITADSLVDAMATDQKIRDKIVTIGDATFLDCVIRVNGGGTLEDPESRKPQILTYYDITTRS